MKSILLTTNHPAPYIDKWVNILRKEYVVDVVYRWRKDQYKQWSNFQGTKGLFFDEISLLEFWKIYKKHDMAILGGWNNLYCFITILFGLFFKTKCCVFSDHPAPTIKINSNYFIRKYCLFNLLDYIFCATESTRHFYHKHYNMRYSKLMLFPYSYNNVFSEQNQIINLDRSVKLNSKDEKINIFIANNFIERKGYNAIVSAFIQMKQKQMLCKYKVKIAGNGELFNKVKVKLDNLNEDITFLGWIESEQYIEEMNNCDIYIHASQFEPFGIPPLDALCRGKLLIASDGVQSVNSIIRNGKNGYIFKANDGIELSEILNNIDKTKIYEIGANGRKLLLETYSDRMLCNACKNILMN